MAADIISKLALQDSSNWLKMAVNPDMYDQGEPKSICSSSCLDKIMVEVGDRICKSMLQGLHSRWYMWSILGYVQRWFAEYLCDLSERDKHKYVHLSAKDEQYLA